MVTVRFGYCAAAGSAVASRKKKSSRFIVPLLRVGGSIAE